MESKSKKIYRKIFEEYHQCCLLPYIEIHHIDGNHNNNIVENLMPVTALEHYEIHKSQGDKAAAALIGIRAGISKEERARLNREQAIKNNAAGISGFKLGHASRAGKKGGLKGGQYAKENKTGIFALSPEKNKQRHLNSVISKLIKNGKMCAWPTIG
jgi:hypothetical protein